MKQIPDPKKFEVARLLDMFRYQDYYDEIDTHNSTYEIGEVPACTYCARLIVETLAKYDIGARIYEVVYDPFFDKTSHQFVVIDSQKEDELPYNLPQISMNGTFRVSNINIANGLTSSPDNDNGVYTVGELRKHAEDTTEELLGCKWSEL